MPQNKLEEIIYSLSVHEQKAFRSFLLSPYFNEDAVLVKLFEVMIKNRESAGVSREEEKKKVFLLLEYAQLSASSEVPDPYWGKEAEFESTFQLLEFACSAILARLTKT